MGCPIPLSRCESSPFGSMIDCDSQHAMLRDPTLALDWKRPLPSLSTASHHGSNFCSVASIRLPGSHTIPRRPAFGFQEWQSSMCCPARSACSRHHHCAKGGFLEPADSKSFRLIGTPIPGTLLAVQNPFLEPGADARWYDGTDFLSATTCREQTARGALDNPLRVFPVSCRRGFHGAAHAWRNKRVGRDGPVMR